MTRSGIICAGNWIVDLIHEVAHWPNESELVRIDAQSRGIGGGPANVIGALASLETGLDLWPMGALGQDELGDFVVAECAKLDLPVDQLARKKEAATAQTHVMSVTGKSRTFFYHGGANDVLSAADFPVGTFAQTNAKVFYLGYLTLLDQLDRLDAAGVTDAARILERAQQAGLITSVDLVSAQRPDFEAIVAAAAPYIDYLIVNEIEAARATGREATNDELNDLLEMGRSLVSKGVCQAAVIHSSTYVQWVGANGANLGFDVPQLQPDEIVSHLGAGDAFCAGLLYAIHEGWTPDKAVRLAMKVARASLQGVTANSAIPPLTEFI